MILMENPRYEHIKSVIKEMHHILLNKIEETDTQENFEIIRNLYTDVTQECAKEFDDILKFHKTLWLSRESKMLPQFKTKHLKNIHIPTKHTKTSLNHEIPVRSNSKVTKRRKTQKKKTVDKIADMRNAMAELEAEKNKLRDELFNEKILHQQYFRNGYNSANKSNSRVKNLKDSNAELKMKNAQLENAMKTSGQVFKEALYKKQCEVELMQRLLEDIKKNIQDRQKDTDAINKIDNATIRSRNEDNIDTDIQTYCQTLETLKKTTKQETGEAGANTAESVKTQMAAPIWEIPPEIEYYQIDNYPHTNSTSTSRHASPVGRISRDTSSTKQNSAKGSTKYDLVKKYLKNENTINSIPSTKNLIDNVTDNRGNEIERITKANTKNNQNASLLAKLDAWEKKLDEHNDKERLLEDKVVKVDAKKKSHRKSKSLPKRRKKKTKATRKGKRSAMDNAEISHIPLPAKSNTPNKHPKSARSRTTSSKTPRSDRSKPTKSTLIRTPKSARYSRNRTPKKTSGRGRSNTRSTRGPHPQNKVATAYNRYTKEHQSNLPKERFTNEFVELRGEFSDS